jgi:hypothetical protein
MKKVLLLFIASAIFMACGSKEETEETKPAGTYSKLVFRSMGFEGTDKVHEETFEEPFYSSGNNESLVMIKNETGNFKISYYNESFPEVKPNDQLQILNVNLGWDKPQELRAKNGLEIVKIEDENELFIKFSDPKKKDVWASVQLTK